MLYITERVIAVIRAELSVFNDVETGGVFLGFADSDSNAFIVESTFSGPLSVHKRQHWEADDQYISYEINRLSMLYKQLTVVGYWHSHIFGGDFSVEDEIINKEYALLNPFGAYCGLVQCSQENELFMFHCHQNMCTPCGYSIISDRFPENCIIRSN